MSEDPVCHDDYTTPYKCKYFNPGFGTSPKNKLLCANGNILEIKNKHKYIKVKGQKQL
jgi:hypothetical protein